MGKECPIYGKCRPILLFCVWFCTIPHYTVMLCGVVVDTWEITQLGVGGLHPLKVSHGEGRFLVWFPLALSRWGIFVLFCFLLIEKKREKLSLKIHSLFRRQPLSFSVISLNPRLAVCRLYFGSLLLLLAVVRREKRDVFCSITDSFWTWCRALAGTKGNNERSSTILSGHNRKPVEC